MKRKFILLLIILSIPYIVNSQVTKAINYSISETIERDSGSFHIVDRNFITFLFSDNSFALTIKDSAIYLCNKAISKALSIISEKEFNTKFRILFISSDDEMEKYTGGRTYGGYVDHSSRIIYMRFAKEEIGPITHELMHMVSMSTWGKPPKSTTWMNEGLSTYAANYCSGYTVEELYRFFLSKNMLFSMDSLTSNFYKNKDMIAYHQSAFIVQYLLENFGIEKFKELWQSGFQDFDKVYGFSFKKLENYIKVYLNNKYPVPPAINWDIVGKGCELINLKDKSK